ncbi:MAG TPA: UDP-N-acetylmuramate dehydrogenase [Thermoanaerobaculia bacterium]
MSGYEPLRRALGADRVRTAEILAPYTTFRIGGPADLFYEPRTADELAAAILAAREHEVPCFLLGLGANILVGDRGFRGLVIRNLARHLEFSPEDGTVRAESGAIVWPDLIEAAVGHGLSGLEHYAGIPSTVGGALWQNLHFLSPAPARERTMFIAEVTRGAEILTVEGERRTVDVNYFELGYDTSVLHHRPDVVLSATFGLTPADPEGMRRIVEENLQWRRERHPPLDSEPSAGSIFKKIEGIGAGRLIDECGLKGARIGGAMVTRRHANIFINTGGATAADVRALIAHCQEIVETRTGHRLEVEISLVGEF